MQCKKVYESAEHSIMQKPQHCKFLHLLVFKYNNNNKRIDDIYE